MGKIVIYIVALWALVLNVVACAHQKSKENKDSAKAKQIQLVIGDGNVRIEEEVLVSENNKTAQFFVNQVESDKFEDSEKKLPGFPWVDESSEYSLSDSLDEKFCDIKITKVDEDSVKSQSKSHYLIKVKIKDGIENSPFESMINGESEGEILLGQYPVNSFESREQVVINETVISYWVYSPKEKTYEIVKKMDDQRFLRKQLTFDPHLKEVENIKYEILSDVGGQTYDQMSVIARFQCGT